jgi:hypothetical protein
MQNRLWAVRDAVLLIRTPLGNFYDTLTDEQKKQFIVETPKADSQAPSAIAQNAQAKAGAGAAMSQQAFARMCGAPGMQQWPVQQIEQTLKPTQAQRDSLATLQKKSAEMGQLLMASCMTPAPSTPMDRLDTAGDRLTAVIFAASNVSLALNDFYGQLSDDQKSRFDSLSN